MDRLQWLFANIDILLMTTSVAFGVIIALIRGEKKILSQILLNLVTEAERQFGDGTGALKKATVIAWAYDYIPTYLKPIITEKRLGKWIELTLKKAKLM